MRNLWLRVEIRNRHAVFSVEDDGCGISEEKMTHLFTGLLDSASPVDSTRNNMGIGLIYNYATKKNLSAIVPAYILIWILFGV